MRSRRGGPRVFMMDLWATVPYYTAYLSKALLAAGVDVQVGSITYYLDRDCFTGRGIRVDPGVVDVVGRFALPKLPRRVLKLGEAMLNLMALVVRFGVRPPDVIHVQYLPMLRWKLPLDFWFLAFCRWRGARIVLTVHDLMPHDTAERYKATFLELYQSVDAIICHSDHIKRRLSDEFAVSAEKVAVIPHGPFFYDLGEPDSEDRESAETLAAFELSGEEPMVLWQGIIFPYKGIDLLLEAWQMVEASGSGARLLIVGTGAPELLAQIREQVKRLNLQQVGLHFRFISTEELVALYRAADVVVYPYRAITTSGALATGLALGKCIVASNLPVFREILTDRQSALLPEAGDAAALGHALLETTQDAALRSRLSQQVNEMQFGDSSWLAIAEETAAIYTLLQHRGVI